MGTPLLWTPRGSGGVSCIERCPHFSIFGTQLTTEVSFQRGSNVFTMARDPDGQLRIFFIGDWDALLLLNTWYELFQCYCKVSGTSSTDFAP